MSADPRECLILRCVSPRGEALVVPAPGDLRWSESVPGGSEDLSCSLLLLGVTVVPPALERMCRVAVIDRRTRETVWSGRLTDPGVTSTPAGLAFQLTAEGDQSETDGFRAVYGLVDRAQESWQAVGEFEGSSGSMSGDLTPGGDYAFDFDLGGGIDLGDLGDLGDFGDDLSIDFGTDFGDEFGGDLDVGDIDLGDFGGDLGDFGGIDFGGTDFPAVADYPGYLGFLQDPDGALGDPLQIPLGGPSGDESWWDGYEPGFTDPGAAATGTTTGTLTVGPGGGGIGRRIRGDGGRIRTRLDEVVSATFRFGSSGSALRIWGWTDAGLGGSGYYMQATTSLLTLWRVDDGAATQLGSAAVSLTVGVTYQAHFHLWPAVIFPDEWTLRAEVGVGGLFSGLNVIVRDLTPDPPYIDTVPGSPNVVVPGRYWGVAASGAAGSSVEFDLIRIFNTD